MYREKIIFNLVKDKDVLDIGSLGQSNEYCLWNIMVGRCKSITGVDLPSAAETAMGLLNVQKQNIAHGKDKRIIYGDMEQLNLGKTFDIAIAGDVIEHVSNQGLFLDNIHRHLCSNGKLVITTPNAKWPTVFLKPNATHVFWHDRYTLLNILKRHNFKLSFMEYYYGNKPHYSWWKVPLVVRQSIIAIAEKC
ncbi:MAG: class I SAM-dependent methyltransferase [Candidatus Electronema sp. VV]